MARIDPQHVDALRALIGERIAVADVDALDNLRASVVNDHRVKDPAKRFRWDLFWALGQETRSGWLEAVGDVRDVHIDTALRAATADWPVSMHSDS